MINFESKNKKVSGEVKPKEDELVVKPLVGREELVLDVINDYDGLFVEAVERQGLYTDPQIVGAMVAKCRHEYLQLLLESNPEVGAAVVYGTVVLRGERYFMNAAYFAWDEYVEPSDKSAPNLPLLKYAVLTGLQARPAAELTKPEAVRFAEKFRQHWSIRDCGDIQAQCPEFCRYREIIDKLNHAMITDEFIASELFEGHSTTMETYLAAVFGSLAYKDSKLQQEGSKALEKCDPLLRKHFEIGLTHNFLRR